jgi:hypothetical protein
MSKKTTKKPIHFVTEKDLERLPVHITPGKAVRVLNRMLNADPEATSALFSHRVPCNKALTNDPTIQVHCETLFRDPAIGFRGVDSQGNPSPDTTVRVRPRKARGSVIKSSPTVGVLGIINGLFGVDKDGWGPIAMFQDNLKINAAPGETNEIQQFVELIPGTKGKKWKMPHP